MPDALQDQKPLLTVLDKIDAETKSIRQATKFDTNAEAWIRLRNGDPTRSRADGEPVFWANMLGNFIERKVAALTQSQPDIRVSGRSMDYTTSGHVITETIKAVLDTLQFDAKIETGADLSATFGFCGFNTSWDPNADFGRGDIVIATLDPRRFHVDHHVRDSTEIQKAQYIRIDTPMPLDDIKRIWPDYAEHIKSDSHLSNYQEMSETVGWGGRRPLRPHQSTPGPYEWATVKEYWLRSNQLNDKTGELIFPNGRVLHRVGQVVLDDGPNPYWDGMWPIDVWDWRVNGESIMGRSDVEEARKLQETLNRIGNAIAKNIILNAAITVIGDYNALQPEDWKRLDNRAARILKKMPGRELQFIPPPPMPDQYLAFMQTCGSYMETLLGVPPTMQGKRQPGVIASSAIEGLMTQAETLIRQVARRLEYVVERIGVKLVSRVIQFYTSDRVMMIRGKDNDWEEYKYKRAELLGEYLKNVGDEQEAEKKMQEFFTNFRFKVTPLSALPSNRIQRGLMALQLYQAGLIDDEECLRVMEWPDWKHVLKRTQEKNTQSKQQAMQEGLPLAMMGVKPADLAPGTGGGGKVRAGRSGTQLKMG